MPTEDILFRIFLLVIPPSVIPNCPVFIRRIPSISLHGQKEPTVVDTEAFS
jgi:hypothetical protein